MRICDWSVVADQIRVMFFLECLITPVLKKSTSKRALYYSINSGPGIEKRSLINIEEGGSSKPVVGLEENSLERISREIISK